MVSFLQRSLLVALGALLGLFLLVPLGALVVGTTFEDFRAGLAHPLTGAALRLSLGTTLASLALVVLLGTPLAWVLARTEGRAARVVETLLQLPIVVPPAVAGIALLVTFGRRGIFGALLSSDEWSLPFTTTAVVLAETFVSAPFFLQAALAAFRRIDPALVVVARSFGASPLEVLLRVAVPLAMPGLVAGAAMSWARALGEFGATLMFAGNLEGRTQTLPLAIYTTLETDLRTARSISIVLVAVALVLLATVRFSLERSPRSARFER